MWNCTAESTQLTPSSLPLACPPRIGGSSSLPSRASQTHEVARCTLHTISHTHTYTYALHNTQHTTYMQHICTHTCMHTKYTHTQRPSDPEPVQVTGCWNHVCPLPFAFWIKHTPCWPQRQKKSDSSALGKWISAICVHHRSFT